MPVQSLHLLLDQIYFQVFVKFYFYKWDDDRKKSSRSFNFCKKHITSLIFGDTGSGKTQIYIKFIQEVLSKNQQIYVVFTKKLQPILLDTLMLPICFKMAQIYEVFKNCLVINQLRQL